VVYFKKDSNRLETIKKFYNWPTVPIIFRREENRNFFLLGGYDDLKKHLLSGWLR
jgi:glutaredoxin-related protein